MSKYKPRQPAFEESDLVNYKLDALEKRIDNIESLLHNKLMTNNGGGLSSELLHMMFDMMKTQINPAVVSVPLSSVAATSATATNGLTNAATTTASDKESKKDEMGTFDTAACMARRRTVV